ncbi:anion permease [Myxococcota bacterium]|nr:anion permease [Myxococcota bacterium]
MWQLGSGLLLGWSLGSNDAANVFGTAVASRMVRFSTAVILASFFVILGAWVDGEAGIETYQKLSPLTPNLAFIVSLAAGLTVALMSFWKLPASTSQAVVGALALGGIIGSNLDPSALIKIVICWIATPIGSALITITLYFVVGKIINRLYLSVFTYDKVMRWSLIVAGSYGAYALGANNVANVTGPFVGPDMLTPGQATLVGGVAIAVGIVTYSRNVMETVGKNLVRLDAFTALIAIMAEGITVHIFAQIGVPVSTSQAIIGAIIGIGILKGVRTINTKRLMLVGAGWLATPVLSAALTLVLYFGLGAAGLNFH